MEAKGKCPAKSTPQTGFPSLCQGPLGAGSSGTAAISSATALAGTSALPSSLPAQSWLCCIHHIPLLPGMRFPVQVPASLQELPPAALQRHWVWTHGHKDTQRSTGRGRLCSRGSQRLFSLQFGGKDPINAVGQHLGEALWHPATSHCKSSTRLAILNSSAGVVHFHGFPHFL